MSPAEELGLRQEAEQRREDVRPHHAKGDHLEERLVEVVNRLVGVAPDEERVGLPEQARRQRDDLDGALRSEPLFRPLQHARRAALDAEADLEAPRRRHRPHQLLVGQVDAREGLPAQRSSGATEHVAEAHHRLLRGDEELVLEEEEVHPCALVHLAHLRDSVLKERKYEMLFHTGATEQNVHRLGAAA